MNKLITSLMALATNTFSNAISKFTPKQTYRSGTYGKRSRIKGKAKPAGTKFKRQCAEGRVGVRGSLTAVTMWAIARGSRIAMQNKASR